MRDRMGSLQEQFKELGFVVLRGVLSSDEIKYARQQLIEIFRETDHGAWWTPSLNIANCLSRYPHLSWIALNNKIIENVRTIFGARDITFVNVFGIQKNMLSGWHRDDGSGHANQGDSYFGNIDLMNESLKCVRVAIYLQGHDENYPGLYVKPRSHLQRSEIGENYECLQISAGDIVLFDVRLIHSGTFAGKFTQFALGKVKGGLKIYIKVISDLARKIFLSLSSPKLSIFLVYGLSNQYTSTYGFNMMENQRSLSGGEKNLPKTIVSEFEKVGVKTLDFSDLQKGVADDEPRE